MRAAGLIVLLCAAPAAAGTLPIIGGHDATAGEWPDAVAVIVNGKATCGGVLVAPDVVVTAGHCCGDPGSTLDPPPDHVRVGALTLSDPTSGETIAVAPSSTSIGGALGPATRGSVRPDACSIQSIDRSARS